MSKLDKFKSAADKAAERDNHQESKQVSNFEPAPEGITPARLVDYIELGVQKRKAFRGKEKKPVPHAIITFELLGKKHIKDIEVDGKTIQIANRVSMTLPIMTDSRASFKKLFEKMRYGRDDIKHMSQMLGEAFKVRVTHNVVGEKDDKRTYVNLTDSDGTYLIDHPYSVTEEEDEYGEIIRKRKKLNVPEMISEPRMFLFDDPNSIMWESIFIDGTREVSNDKGENKTVSNNWIQERIKSALNFEGSATQSFLEGSEDLPENPDDLEEFDEEELEEALEEEEELDEEFEEAPKKSVSTAKKSSTETKSKSTKKDASTTTKSPSKKNSAAALEELGLKS